MLPKERRIPRSEFSYILSNGRRFNSPTFLLYVAKNMPNMAKSKTKIAFSVSKKVCKLATDRNRLRRQGYSVLEKKTKNLKDGFLLFFSFKKQSKPIIYKTLESDITELLYNAGVLI